MSGAVSRGSKRKTPRSEARRTTAKGLAPRRGRRATGKAAAAARAPVARTAELRGNLRLSRQDFARLSGFSVRKIADLEKGGTTKSSTAQRLTELQRLQEGLARVMKADFVGEWLCTPNDAFDGLKPLEVVERGQVDRIWRMIYLLEAGEPV